MLYVGSTAGLCASAGRGATPSGEGNIALAERLSSAGDARWAIANAAPSGFTIRRDVAEVRLHFSVADERGKLLDSVSGDELRILDNRRPVEQLRNLSRTSDLPLQIGVLLDVSDSMQKTVFREKQAAQYFFAHVFRPETDRSFLLAFGNDVKVLQSSTADRESLTRALGKVSQAGFATYLYDSIFSACLEDFPVADDGTMAQRILVLFSDGDDTGSLHTQSEAIALAQHREVQIYAVTVHSPHLAAPGDNILPSLADATGGQFSAAHTDKDIPALFGAMERQMRAQFAVSFRPSEWTAGYHTLQVQVSGAQTVRVRARQGYYFDAP